MPISESEHFGIFRAAVFTADRALPVEGAEILIFEQGATSPIFRLTTDGSGLTEPIPLKAPPAADSLRPGQALFSFFIANPFKQESRYRAFLL